MITAIPPIKTPFPSPLARPIPRPLQLDPSCVFYWDGIDKLSQRKVLDESGKGNHGVIVGATYVPDGLSFDGVDDVVNIANNASLSGMPALSVFGWFKLGTSISGGSNPSEWSILWKVNSYRVYFSSSSSRLVFTVWNGAGNANAFSDRTAWTAGVWHHYRGYYDGTTVLLYIDDVLQTDTGTVVGPVGTTTTSLVFGQNLDSSTNGMGIWTRTLSENEGVNIRLLGKARLGI